MNTRYDVVIIGGGIGGLMAAYGVDSKTPAETPYAVFDFDNTSSIFDVEEQLSIYQAWSSCEFAT